MERETSCYGVGRSIAWSTIGVDVGGKKEEEKEREKDRRKEGKIQGKRGKKKGEREDFAGGRMPKTGCLGKK